MASRRRCFIHTRLTVDRACELIEDLPTQSSNGNARGVVCDFRSRRRRVHRWAHAFARAHETGVPPSRVFSITECSTLVKHDVRAPRLSLPLRSSQARRVLRKRDGIGDGLGVGALANSIFVQVAKADRSVTMPSGAAREMV